MPQGIEKLLAQWDEAAEPDARGCHDGGGFALQNWAVIRSDLRWLLDEWNRNDC